METKHDKTDAVKVKSNRLKDAEKKHVSSPHKSKLSGWWVWIIITGLWVFSTIGSIIQSVRGAPKLAGLVMIPGAFIMLLRFLGPPLTLGRGLLLLMGCFMSISVMVWLIYGKAFGFLEIVCTIITIILIWFGFKWKKSRLINNP